ncbi:hypothetical protein BOX15_Mlig019140g1 [Macrostomum lignano]|uniref:Uncharacterized protein n=1 Tax=Macrostomum lignano TaxID=282301 RepID=A0A267GQA7_9PLAT|nr:hypothetical protein BOX15_Mlig019140g1 [Macrostomum lignano]
MQDSTVKAPTDIVPAGTGGGSNVSTSSCMEHCQLEQEPEVPTDITRAGTDNKRSDARENACDCLIFCMCCMECCQFFLDIFKDCSN